MLRLLPIWLSAGCQFVFPVASPNPGDAPADALPEMQVCGGNEPTALFQGCVTTTKADLPSQATLDTGRVNGEMGDCTSLIAQGDPANPELCVIAAQSITIGNTVVIGERPLLLASTTTLIVAGLLSASSAKPTHDGPGANFEGCTSRDLLAGTSLDSGGGGGGGGGSFGSRGGRGGAGSGPTTGGPSVEDLAPITTIRGGCPGGKGGNIGGLGGSGGGAIYLLANRIRIQGRVEASGAGGLAGDVGTQTEGGGGGGGGGSGGMIALDAASIDILDDARLIANGGGGGPGGPAIGGAKGTDGGEPNPMTFPFLAQGGVAIGSGNGGAGGNAMVLPGVTGNPNDNGTDGTNVGAGGGGGGGGVGHIYVFGALTASSAVMPSPAFE